jgi:4-carboxymuconolactone decarboxylase
MKQIFYIILFICALSLQVTAQNNSIFPKGEIGKNTTNYTGTIWLSELNHSDTIFNLGLAQATFAPASKLDWHIHPAGQYLLVTQGRGYYQERDKPVQIVHKGDVIKCLPNVEHWHGATQNSDFAYIGVTPTQKGKTIWLKRVTDEEYINLPKETATIISDTSIQNEIKDLSKQKWQWMSDKNVETLNNLFDDKAMFVHMGGSWGKTQELDVIKSGGIWYKKAEIYSVTVNIIGNTAILLNDIDLEAVVGGNTVTNPFMVTEVYVKENGKWKMGSLTFSKLLRPVKTKN